MAMRTIEAWLIALQCLQVAFLLLHDWVPLGRLTNLQAVRGLDSTAGLFWTTVFSALPFLLPLVFCCAYWLAPGWPMWLQMWLWWTYGLNLAAVLFAWWIPYLSPSDSARAARYRVRFAGTLTFLPQRHGFAPDALHTTYHLTIVATLLLLALLRS